MHSTKAILLEDAIQLAWDYLDDTGQLGDPTNAAHVLQEEIFKRIEQGEISRFVLSNRAIGSYLNQEGTEYILQDQCEAGCDTSE